MSNKKYWLGLNEIKPTTETKKKIANEFPTALPFEDAEGILDAKTPRRDFLKYLGFSTAAAVAVASCAIPERKALSWANKPAGITPGVPLFYASTYVDGGEAIPVIVKTREGRPIKIEGNPDSAITEGASTARLQGSILSLYDVTRLKQPRLNGKEANTWEAVDNEVAAAMSKVGSAPIYLVTSTINSPSELAAIAAFKAKYSNVQHVMYDAVSYSGLLDAAQAATGKRAIPTYQFDKAKTIVSIGADFLGTWLNPAAFAKAYSKGRKLTKTNNSISKHYQIEGLMTISGGAADVRTTCRPSEYGKVAVALLDALSGTTPNTGSKNLDITITNAAKDLKAGAGIVVSGSNDPNVQQVVFAINSAIGAMGTTVNTAVSELSKQGDDKAMNSFVTALLGGSLGGVLFYDCNPVYEHAKGGLIKDAIKKLPLAISFSDREDETAQVCKVIAPTHHWLESWGDSEIRSGYFSFQQPTISPLFKTRAFAESLAKWSGNTTASFDKDFQAAWKSRLGSDAAFETAVQSGVLQPAAMASGGSYSGSPAAAKAAILAEAPVKGMEVVVYEKVAIGRGGVHSNNPWLQETPDPITKATWDNYILMSPKKALELGAELTDLNEVDPAKKVFELAVGNQKIKLPVAVTPGMNDNVIAVAVGYGRDAKVGRTAASNSEYGGKNAYLFTGFNATTQTISFNAPVTLTDAKEKYKLAITQTHHSYEQREAVVKETTLEKYQKDPNALYDTRIAALHHYTENADEAAAEAQAKLDEKNGKHKEAHGAHEAHGEAKHGEAAHGEAHHEGGAHGEAHGDAAHANHDPEELYRVNGTLYTNHKYPGLKWGLSIDLNSCIGCGSCSVACQAENNISVVGKEQVILAHEMHWMRIDRYYTSTTNNEQDSDSIQTVFMPMMCQHCDNAPCENVCPVNASNHSSEGMNQMAYNRCIGTRYCANNCPFKVRRFNWRDWNGADSFADNQFEDPRRDDINDDLTRMVLNPEVTVRSRGVIEKCSFCVQRTQAAKAKAKSENRVLADGDAVSACAQACPTNAIVFGNVNDKNSEISKIRGEENRHRVYYALEELHVLPNVNYLYKVRNANAAGNPNEDQKAAEGQKAENHHA
jgi:MoCo/4Fe-4S cofactor protein with predicted Tat translocation signal